MGTMGVQIATDQTADVIEAIPQRFFTAAETVSAAVPITSRSSVISAVMDATNYVPGTEFEFVLQWQTDPQAPWQEVSARVTERGTNKDGTPATFWEVGALLSGPLPTTAQSKVVVRIQKGAGVVSTAAVKAK